MIKEQFKMVTPSSAEATAGKPADAEAIKNKRQEAGSLNNEIMSIQGGKNLEDLEVDELKKVLELYKKIRNLGKGDAETREGKIEGSVEEQISRAREIMGDSEVMGPNEIKNSFGVEMGFEEVPPIPFSESELERAKELGQFLVLRVPKAKDGQPFTMQKINESLEKDFKDKSKGKILYKVDWYSQESFYTGGKEKEPADYSLPRAGWALTTKDFINNSTSKNYLQQTEEIAEYLKTEVYKDIEMPEEYREAIDELDSKKDKLQKLLKTGDKSKYEPEISKLKLNKLTRQSPAEVLYDILIYFQNNDERLLEGKFAWTHTAGSDGDRVIVGDFGSGGADVGGDSDDSSSSDLGAVFSRNF